MCPSHPLISGHLGAGIHVPSLAPRPRHTCCPVAGPSLANDDGPRATIGMLAGGTVTIDGPVWPFPIHSLEAKPFWEGEQHDPSTPDPSSHVSGLPSFPEPKPLPFRW